MKFSISTCEYFAKDALFYYQASEGNGKAEGLNISERAQGESLAYTKRAREMEKPKA